MSRAARARSIFVLTLSLLFLGAVACGGGGRGGGSSDDSGGGETSLAGGGTGGSGSTGGGSPPVALEMRILDEGPVSYIKQARTWTARSEAEYLALWDAHRTSGGSATPPPAVDFTTEIVVAVFIGEHVAGGYSVELMSAETDGADGARVRYDRVVPAPGSPPGLPSFVWPYSIAAISRVEGTVFYDEAVRTLE
jgi:hypothetical protein